MFKVAFLFAALSGLMSVGMGAFGAHALRQSLEPRLMNAFETGVAYQMSHSLVLLIVCLLATHWGKSLAIQVSAIAFMLGILLFSGSLYALVLTEYKWLGPVTPIGGLALMVGWLLLLIAVWQNTAF
ncbi:MAG: DUF423 domain-containing protein [Pseudomonadales bacterium]